MSRALKGKVIVGKLATLSCGKNYMSYQTKLEAALSLIEKHNAAIGTNPEGHANPGQVNPKEFQELLKAAGFHEESHLSGMSQEEILELLPSYKNIKPRMLAKDIAKVFRDKAVSLDPIKAKHVPNMSIPDLVAHLNPEEPSSPVAERLNKIVNNQPFIIFSSGRIVDVENTLKVVNELRSGRPATDFWNVNGQPKKIYSLGELPENFADENPLFHGRPLRSDESCDQSLRSWSGVPQSVRQLIYLAVKSGNIDVTVKNGMMVAHDVITLAVSADAEKKLRSLYPKVSLEFDKLAETGNLPTLKVALGGGGNIRPFPEGKKVVWKM